MNHDILDHNGTGRYLFATLGFDDVNVALNITILITIITAVNTLEVTTFSRRRKFDFKQGIVAGCRMLNRNNGLGRIVRMKH